MTAHVRVHDLDLSALEEVDRGEHVLKAARRNAAKIKVAVTDPISLVSEEGF